MFGYKLIFVIEWSTNKLLPKVDNFIRKYHDTLDAYYSIGYSNINGNGAYRVSLKLVKQTKLRHR